jgi:hypothetical protein
MKDHERRAPIAQPTSERTADQSTQTASGLSADRPERQYGEDDDVVARTNRGEETPRRYDTDAEDDVTPSDDGPIGTKI